MSLWRGSGETYVQQWTSLCWKIGFKDSICKNTGPRPSVMRIIDASRLKWVWLKWVLQKPNFLGRVGSSVDEYEWCQSYIFLFGFTAISFLEPDNLEPTCRRRNCEKHILCNFDSFIGSSLWFFLAPVTTRSNFSTFLW